VYVPEYGGGKGGSGFRESQQYEFVGDDQSVYFLSFVWIWRASATGKNFNTMSGNFT
jgi:hypothetical protein